MRAAVLVPIKDFRRAKQRLSSVLSPDQRNEAARQMAAHVLAVAAPYEVFVVCDDPGVADFARDHQAQVLWQPNVGLNGAIDEAVRHIASRADRILIAHSDLPLAVSFADVMDTEGVAAVTDRHGRGTNVMALPTSFPFTFRFGSGSFAAHQAEARRHRHIFQIVEDPRLSWDVDTPEDLHHPDVKEFFSWLPTSPDNPHSQTDQTSRR